MPLLDYNKPIILFQHFNQTCKTYLQFYRRYETINDVTAETGVNTIDINEGPTVTVTVKVVR